MNQLAIITAYNRPGKKDATGAFVPEGRRWGMLYGAERFEIMSPYPAIRRRESVENAIRAMSNLDVLAVFGHGTQSSLIATGHGMKHIADLAAAIRHGDRPQTVILYACSTARGKRGFADVLAAALPHAHVWAHTTAGHATWNPYVELAGGPNNGDPVWTLQDGRVHWRRWYERLREDQDYRLSWWVPAHGTLTRAEALNAVRGTL